MGGEGRGCSCRRTRTGGVDGGRQLRQPTATGPKRHSHVRAAPFDAAHRRGRSQSVGLGPHWYRSSWGGGLHRAECISELEASISDAGSDRLLQARRQANWSGRRLSSSRSWPISQSCPAFRSKTGLHFFISRNSFSTVAEACAGAGACARWCLNVHHCAHRLAGDGESVQRAALLLELA